MKTKFFLNLGRSAGIVMGAGFALSASAGTPNFTTGPTLDVAADIYSVVSADFMGNGKQDMVTVDGTMWLNTSPGDGSVSFSPIPVISAGNFLAVADFNGDGKPDLVETLGSDQVAVFLNTTQSGDTIPSFAAPVYFNVTGISSVVTTADVNGDGLPDLIVTDTGAYVVNVLINTTTPGSSTVTFGNFQSFTTGNGANWVVAGDLNGDGSPDMVVANNLDNTISVFINTTPIGSPVASFTAQQVFSIGNLPNMLALADINGDHSLDIVAANNSENAISVLLNTTPNGSTTASFAAEETFATGDVPDSVVAVDVDGDGMPDLVAANAQDGTVTVIHNLTAPGAAAASFDTGVTFTEEGSDPEFLIATDLNGDGKPDLAVLNTMSPDSAQVGSISLLINDSF